MQLKIQENDQSHISKGQHLWQLIAQFSFINSGFSAHSPFFAQLAQCLFLSLQPKERKKYKGGLISTLNIRAIGVFLKIIDTRETYTFAVSIPFDSADMTISNKN